MDVTAVDVTALADRLVAELAGYGRTLVTFSGGVDSSVVLAGAVRALGTGQVAALTAVSSALPADELAYAARFCAELGVTQHTPRTREMDRAGYRANGPMRCYFCKSTLLETAIELGTLLDYPVIATGTNASDVAAGFRPGIRAAAARGARTPLADQGLDKQAVRAIAAHWGLSTQDKPAAACLSSRIAYGIEISPQRLARVERAELAARALLGGDKVGNLRVRDLGGTVRVEVDEAALPRARAHRELVGVLRAAGFVDVAVTVEAFRSGSMNELLPDPDRWRHT